MCGLLAAAGPVPPALLTSAVMGAARRGPHGSGVAVYGADGEKHWRTRRSTKTLLIVPRPGRRFTRLIAHSRLATDSADPGGLPRAVENQPVCLATPAGPAVLAHNGSDAALLADSPPRDSRALLELLADPDAELPAHHFTAPQALILGRADGSIHAARLDGDDRPAHPLYLTRDPSPRSDWWLLSSNRLDFTSTLLPTGELVLVP